MKSQIVETVTIAQAKDTIAQAADIYFARDQRGRYRVERRRARPVCLMGPAGVGKTEIVRQVARDKGLAFLSYSITHHTRQSIIGLPRLVQGTVGDRTVSMTEYTMSEIIAQIYRTMEDTGLQEGILFLDEFNCASESLRPIMLQLLQDKSFGPHAIPDGWMLVLAGNPAEYNRAASDLDPVTADRMRLVHIVPDYPAWRAYAKTRNIHPVVLSYLDNHKDHFYVCRRDDAGTALVTARGWEDLSVMMTCLEMTGRQPDLALTAQYVQAGDVARSFFNYYTQYASVIASGTIEQVLAASPKALADIKRMNFQRSWSLVSALLRRVQTMAEEAAGLDDTAAAVYGQLRELAEQLEQEPALVERLSEELAARCDRPADRPAQDILRRWAMGDVNAPAGWERVKKEFAAQVREPRMEAYRRTGTAITNILTVCRKALEGQPHLEFLFNTIADSAAVLRVLAGDDFPQFKQLLRDVSFDPEEMEKALAAQITEHEEL